MDARPSQILEFFDGTKQMLVPLFQRPYEWGQKSWETLWLDLMEQYERGTADAVASHFTGAIVTAPARSVPVGVSKHLVIDGQQRLTTVAVLICAIRSMIDRGTPRYRKLTRLLINEDDEGLDRYKLLPTQPDRAAFQALLAERPQPGAKLTEAFNFFRERLRGTDSNGDAIDAERVIDAMQSRLTVVSINLGETDDPYLIFESLNAKGMPLSQADLIRNYVLLRLQANAQQAAYEEAWLPMQALLPGDHLTEFMRQFLMLNGEEVAKSAIYSVLKRRLASLSEAGVASELDRMHGASRLYAQIVGLVEVEHTGIRDALARLRRWEVTTANPLVLRMLCANAAGETSVEDVDAILAIIESFVVRRAVCGVPTNQLKRIFLSLTKDLPVVGGATWLSRALAAGGSGRRWPKDEEFLEALGKHRAYVAPLDRCKFILECIEADHGHQEPASFASATLEHVLPQTLTPEWRAMLGGDADAVHERWCDVLGNLTLTGYNPQLSNSPFATKRKLLRESHFEMNKWIASRDAWTQAEIQARTELIFERARRIWARPRE